MHPQREPTQESAPQELRNTNIAEELPLTLLNHPSMFDEVWVSDIHVVHSQSAQHGPPMKGTGVEEPAVSHCVFRGYREVGFFFPGVTEVAEM